MNIVTHKSHPNVLLPKAKLEFCELTKMLQFFTLPVKRFLLYRKYFQRTMKIIIVNFFVLNIIIELKSSCVIYRDTGSIGGSSKLTYLFIFVAERVTKQQFNHVFFRHIWQTYFKSTEGAQTNSTKNIIHRAKLVCITRKVGSISVVFLRTRLDWRARARCYYCSTVSMHSAIN